MLKPTRCTPHSASVIDHILSNSQMDSFKSIILLSKMSDHFLIFYFSHCKNISPKKTKISYRDFSDTNIVRFSESPGTEYHLLTMFMILTTNFRIFFMNFIIYISLFYKRILTKTRKVLNHGCRKEY